MYIFLVSLGMISRVGINGLGRIGRVIFRTCLESKDLEVTAINDPAVDIEYICYLIKFDSTHGKLHSDVSFSANEIFIDGRKIKVFCERLPSNIPWKSVDVHYVVEASGMFTSLEKASGHLASESVRRVIITAPTIDVPMLILGVNMEQINTEQKVISCASSTLYCLAPIIKILEDNYGVAEGFITSIHAMTPSLKPLDGLCLKGKHWRDHRSIHQNIIPAATGACKALGKIIPQVKDKMTGLAFRVPIVNVSVLDITIRLKKATTIQDIIKCVQSESKTNMKNIIKISKDQEVSSDFLGDQNSCIFDVNSSLQLNSNFFKLICWYENEYSYACRVIDSMKYLEENHYKLKTISKIPFAPIIKSKRSIPMKSIPNFNKEYVSFNCQIQNNPKKLLSTSQDTGFKESSSERQVTHKRSFSFRNSESNQLALCKTNVKLTNKLTKRNEIFKVWNDEVQTSRPVVKDKNLFFHSCMSLRPSYMRCNNYRKTQHRLEEVKKEFSKMVNMTENVLKKSNQKCENNILDGKSIDREEITEKVLNFDLNIQLPDANDQTVSRDAVLNPSISIYDDVLKTSKKDNSNSLIDKHIEMICDVCDFNKITDKNLRKLNQKNNQGDENIEKENYVKANDEAKLQGNIILEKPTSDIAKSSFVPIQFNSEDSYTNKANHLDFLNVKLSKHILQYDEVSIPSNPEPYTSCRYDSDGNPSVNDTKADFIKPNKSIVKEEITLYSKSIDEDGLQDKTIRGKKAMRKKIIEGIIRKLSVETTHGDRTPSPSIENTVTTVSNEGNRCLDLYDKLDSASATDSDNSFEINERRSQIIDITDLTSSAEDLDRLDKICRIIEISDDLSNRSFSVLDNTNPDIKKKKWSFKDLCERLKLDEFCNTVFGPSSSY